MTTLRSDVGGRDDLLRTQALETSRFPEARFSLSEPVDLPDVQIGDVVSLQIPGDLTLHGQTSHVVIELQARWDGPSIQVAGSAPNPTAPTSTSPSTGSPGFRIDSSGSFEVQLALVPPARTSSRPRRRSSTTRRRGPGSRTMPRAPATPSPPSGHVDVHHLQHRRLDIWIAEPGAEPVHVRS